MKVQSFAMGEGDAGVEQTVNAMRGLIDQGKKNGDVQECVAGIIRQYHVPAFDYRREFRAIFDWVRRHVRFTRDPTGVEGLRSADTTLRLGIADCDCFSVLMCSLLGAIGHRTRLVTISNQPSDPEQFSHIFPEVLLDGQWIPMDAGRKNPAFGKGPRSFFRKRIWDVDTGEYQDVQGLGGIVRHRALMGAGTTRTPGMGSSPGTPFFRASQAGRVPQKRSGLRGMGDDSTGWDWSQFESTLPALTTDITSGVAKIITAQSAPAITAANTSALITSAQLQSTLNPLSSISPTTLLLLGGGLLLVMMMGREQ